jgi:hypothetical protein
MANFVSPTGYVDLDNDCEYSIDRKSVRGRENVNPKEDLAFYFETYLVPKYGLNNINVNNTASYLKELEMNWTKLSPELKEKVMDIMVDGILNKNFDFKNKLIQKLGIVQPPPPTVSKFGDMSGKSVDNGLTMVHIAVGVVFLGIVLFVLNRVVKNKLQSFAKFS